jgi:hypothetical protein
MRTRPRLRTLLALALPLAAAAASAQEQTRTVSHALTPAAGEEVRFANLAGHVEVVPTASGPVRVDATVHARGRDGAETGRLLAGMKWVRERDSSGKPAWVLSYPVDDYETFHYPKLFDGGDDPGLLETMLGRFAGSTVKYRGEAVRITGRSGPGAPTLYADLRVTMPRGARLAVVNHVGDVRAGALEGVVTLDTGSGAIDVESCRGELYADTGSGEVRVGSVDGKLHADTGSGDIAVRSLRGSGLLDTGSGSVSVDGVEATRLTIDTGSGEVRVRNGSVRELSADTGSGDIEVRRVEVEQFVGDTGSGGVTLESSLANTREVLIDTGSGSVEILGGADASFEIKADQGSGDLEVGYRDAVLRYEGREVVGAKRGSGRTEIVVSTGSGDCRIAPGSR